MYIYIYIYIYTFLYIFICIYVPVLGQSAIQTPYMYYIYT